MMGAPDIRKGNHIEHFDSVDALINAVNDRTPHQSWLSPSDRRDAVNKSGDFYGVSLPQAINLAAHGWPQGLSDLQKTLGLSPYRAKSRSRQFHVAGDFPDIGRFLSGVPDVMSRTVTDPTIRRPIIELIINVAVSCTVEKSSIINYGGALVSVLDELENVGFSVSLIVGSAVKTHTNRTIGLTLDLKRPGEPLELDRLAFFLAHPSSLRRIMFAHWETITEYNDLKSNYGWPSQFPDRSDDVIHFPKHSIELNTLAQTPEHARAYVRSHIKSLRPDLFTDEREAA